MREWYLGADLVELERTPSSLRAISQKAKREKWKSRSSGVGKAFEYHISSLPEDMVRQLQDKFGFSDTELDEARFWADRKELTVPSESYVTKLSLELGQPTDLVRRWIMAGELPHESDESNQSQPTEVTEDQTTEYIAELLPTVEQISLPLYDVEASAGHGALIVKEGKTNSITFSKQFINESIGVNTKNVFLMPVRGDSMAPTLNDKALIMVDRIDEFTVDGVYVFRFDSKLMVKRLQFTKTGLKVVSDNSSYDQWDLTRNDISTEDFEIIGKVVWSGQRM